MKFGELSGETQIIEQEASPIEREIGMAQVKRSELLHKLQRAVPGYGHVLMGQSMITGLEGERKLSVRERGTYGVMLALSTFAYTCLLTGHKKEAAETFAVINALQVSNSLPALFRDAEKLMASTKPRIAHMLGEFEVYARAKMAEGFNVEEFEKILASMPNIQF